MATKQLSMKRLYKFAGEYLMHKYAKEVNDENLTIFREKANEELAELTRFLRYVWEHRNDEI